MSRSGWLLVSALTLFLVAAPIVAALTWPLPDLAYDPTSWEEMARYREHNLSEEELRGARQRAKEKHQAAIARAEEREFACRRLSIGECDSYYPLRTYRDVRAYRNPPPYSFFYQRELLYACTSVTHYMVAQARNCAPP